MVVIITKHLNIFYRFFESYPQYLEYFTYAKNKKCKDNYLLHAHGILVLNTLGQMIDSGLRDPPLFEQILTSVVKAHRSPNLTKSDVKVNLKQINYRIQSNFFLFIQKLGAVIVKYLNDTLSRQTTKTFEEASNAIVDRIINAFPDAIVDTKSLT